MKKKKEYYKPETRYVLVGIYSMLMLGSRVQPEGDAGEGEDGGEWSRSSFWEDFDEDLLDDMDKDDINELDK